MRKTFLLLTSIALTTLLVSGVALAYHGIRLNIIRCDGGRCLGTPKADLMRGTVGRDIIYGLKGHDELYGQSGRDDLYGFEGNDSNVVGGPGNDKVSGGDGRDGLGGGRGSGTRREEGPKLLRPGSPR
jgi:Ca2+-binding RTX toxin-like protein